MRHTQRGATRQEDTARAALRRRPSALWLVVAVMLLGGVTASGTTAVVRSGGGRLAGLGEQPMLGGFLPIEADDALAGFLDPAQLAAVPVGAGKVAEPVRAVLSSARLVDALGESGIPDVAVRAYKRAEAALARDDPSCGLRWTLLAAIGRVESNHGRFGGARLREDGYGTRPIRGIALDGRPNVALIRDSDAGALDGDGRYDRAVGPMQFIPSTWRAVGVDGNGDGRRDPNNIFDAARGAAAYLCAGDADLRDLNERAGAVRRYNNADEYVRVVLRLAGLYETGRVEELPSLPALLTAAVPRPSVPPPAPRGTTTPPPAAHSRPAPSPAPASPDREPSPAPESSDRASSPAPTPPDGSPSPAPGTAAVGWAPAMREVVVDIIDKAPAPSVPSTTTSTTTAPAAPPPGDTPAAGGPAPTPCPMPSPEEPTTTAPTTTSTAPPGIACVEVPSTSTSPAPPTGAAPPTKSPTSAGSEAPTGP